jgi:hypothetical protein
MIHDYLAKAVEIGADRLEIEYEDRAELVTDWYRACSSVQAARD